MAHFMATTTNVTAEETTKLFRIHVHELHGIPLKLIWNRNVRFTGRVWQELHYFVGTQLAMSTSFHPQTDGQTKRLNRVIEDKLGHYVSPPQDDWCIVYMTKTYGVYKHQRMGRPDHLFQMNRFAFEKSPGEVQDFRKLSHHPKGI
jgi:hypothetical protein